jgi:hypothetical protein
VDRDDLLAAGELSRPDAGKICQVRLKRSVAKSRNTFHLSDSNITGACASRVGCGFALRVFPVRLRACLGVGVGETNAV